MDGALGRVDARRVVEALRREVREDEDASGADNAHDVAEDRLAVGEVVEDVERHGRAEHSVPEGKGGAVGRCETNSCFEARADRERRGDFLVLGAHVDAFDVETAARELPGHDAHSRSQVQYGSLERPGGVEDECRRSFSVVSEGRERFPPGLKSGLAPIEFVSG